MKSVDILEPRTALFRTHEQGLPLPLPGARRVPCRHGRGCGGFELDGLEHSSSVGFVDSWGGYKAASKLENIQ